MQLKEGLLGVPVTLEGRDWKGLWGGVKGSLRGESECNAGVLMDAIRRCTVEMEGPIVIRKEVLIPKMR